MTRELIATIRAAMNEFEARAVASKVAPQNKAAVKKAVLKAKTASSVSKKAANKRLTARVE